MSTETKQKVRIKGNYTTALTKLFLDKNWDIAQPSEEIRKRFDLEENWEKFSVDIWDRKGKNGIMIQGNVEETMDTIRNLPDIVIKKKPYDLGGIYKGNIIKEDRNSLRVDIGPTIGEIPKDQVSEEKDEIIVKVEGAQNELTLSSEISIPGHYCVLIPDKGVKVSRKIQNGKLRNELIELGRDIDTGDWGIIWRSSAAEANETTLRKSVKELVEQKKKLKEFNPAPNKIIEGKGIAEIIFSKKSKSELDNIRNKVSPTISGHHRIKSAEKDLSFGISVAEEILKVGEERETVEKGFKNSLLDKLKGVGDSFFLEHDKLDENYMKLGPGRIINLDDSDPDRIRVTIKRELSEGSYDGLNKTIEEGDVAITEIVEGKMSYKHSYYSKNGKYHNINTPLEVYSDHARYIDLGVDVVKWPNGNKKIIDQEILKKSRDEGKITEKTYEKAMDKAKEIYNSI